MCVAKQEFWWDSKSPQRNLNQISEKVKIKFEFLSQMQMVKILKNPMAHNSQPSPQSIKTFIYIYTDSTADDLKLIFSKGVGRNMLIPFCMENLMKSTRIAAQTINQSRPYDLTKHLEYKLNNWGNLLAKKNWRGKKTLDFYLINIFIYFWFDLMQALRLQNPQFTLWRQNKRKMKKKFPHN